MLSQHVGISVIDHSFLGSIHGSGIFMILICHLPHHTPMHLHCHYNYGMPVYLLTYTLPYIPKRKHGVHAHACYTVQFHSYLQLVIVLKLYISEQASRSAHVIDDTALHATLFASIQASRNIDNVRILCGNPVFPVCLTLFIINIHPVYASNKLFSC